MHVQLQPARSPELDADAAASRIAALAPAVVTRGDDAGPYINIDFRPTEMSTLWTAVQAELVADPRLAACVIACCEGERGWDDYLLLHHYDPSEPLDMV